MGIFRLESTTSKLDSSSVTKMWNVTSDSQSTYPTNIHQSFQLDSGVFSSSAEKIFPETTISSDLTTEKKEAFTSLYGTPEINGLQTERSLESKDSVSRSVNEELASTGMHSITTEIDVLQNSTVVPVVSTEVRMDTTRKLSLVSESVSETEVFSNSHFNTTEEISTYVQNYTVDSPVNHSDITTVLLDFSDTSAESFMFVKPNATDVQNFSVSSFTSSLFGEEIISNSTFMPERTKIHDVIMQENAIVDDVNTAVMVTKAVMLTILAVGGVIGNALVIWSVVKRRHLHRPPFYYLLSLSLTDLSRAAFCLPLVLMTLLQGSVWRHGNSACDLFAFANSFFVLSSSVSLLDVAADRHLSLVYARSYRRRAGGAVNLVVVLLGWTLAFLVAFPPVVGVGAYAFQESEGQCTLRHKYFRHDNDTLGFLMVFTGLSLLTLFLYYRIFVALRAHRKMRPLQHEPARSATWTFVGPGANGQAFVNWVNGFGGTNVPHLPNVARNPPRPNLARVVSLHVARNQHVTRLFFMMTLTFTLLWLPYQVLSYWRVFNNTSESSTAFVTVAAWLSYAQVAVCPLVYFLTRGHLRRRPSRADIGADDKQEYLLESVNRKK